MSLNTSARGKTVYGQGSFAPTRGRVSAQGALGYVKRELSKPMTPLGPYSSVSRIGNDGRSDTRSGVASRMLRSSATNTSGSGSQPTSQALGGPKPVSYSSNPTGPNQQPSGPTQRTGGPLPGNPNAVGGESGFPATPSVTLSASGQLQLPWDSQFSMDSLNAFEDMNSRLLDLNTQSQQFDLEFMKNRHNADKGYDRQKRGTLNRNASDGTAFSSAYGFQATEDANEYNNYIGDLTNQKALFDQRSALERSMIQNAFNNMLRQNALSQAEKAVGSGIGSGPEPEVDAPTGGGGDSGGDSGGGDTPAPNTPKPPAKKNLGPYGKNGKSWVKKGWEVADLNNDNKTTEWEVDMWKVKKGKEPSKEWANRTSDDKDGGRSGQNKKKTPTPPKKTPPKKKGKK